MVVLILTSVYSFYEYFVLFGVGKIFFIFVYFVNSSPHDTSSLELDLALNPILAGAAPLY